MKNKYTAPSVETISLSAKTHLNAGTVVLNSNQQGSNLGASQAASRSEQSWEDDE